MITVEVIEQWSYILKKASDAYISTNTINMICVHYLDAAVTEFLQKGYEGASVDAIAKKAGVNKGGLYHHFTKKILIF